MFQMQMNLFERTTVHDNDKILSMTQILCTKKNDSNFFHPFKPKQLNQPPNQAWQILIFRPIPCTLHELLF